MALIVIRPAVDIFGNTVLLEISQIPLNLSSLISLFTIIWSVYFLYKNKVRAWQQPLFLPILAFIIISLLSIFYTSSLSVTLRELFRIMGVFFLFFVAASVFKTDGKNDQLIKAIFLSLILPIVFAVFQFISNTGLSFGDVSNRVYGTFGHPNVLAFYLVFSIGIILAQSLSGDKKKVINITNLLLLVLFLLLLLTYTRGAWLGLLVIILIFGLLKYKKALIISLAAIILLLFMAPTLNRLAFTHLNIDFQRVPVIKRITEFDSEDSSIDWRLKLWGEMKTKFNQKPLLGYGLGTFPIIREQQTRYFFQGTEAHNDYLRLAIETGLLGFLSYFIILLILLYKSFKIYWEKRNDRYSALAIGFLSLTVSMIIMSFFDNLLQATSVMWLFWIIAAANLRILSSK